LIDKFFLLSIPKEEIENRREKRGLDQLETYIAPTDFGAKMYRQYLQGFLFYFYFLFFKKNKK